MYIGTEQNAYYTQDCILSGCTGRGFTVFFSNYCTFRHSFFYVDLVTNNFFKTVNTNLEHPVFLKNFTNITGKMWCKENFLEISEYF